jgi:nucleoside-diphosphate-sugar epimerase
MKRVLVTGAGGFVGRHVTSALVRGGAEVHAVGSRAKEPGNDGCTWHAADLLDPRQVRELVKTVRADTLMHLAWCAKPPDYWTDVDNLRWLAASLELVRLFAEHGGARAVGVGSCAEYDWDYGYCTEAVTPLKPGTLYGTTKAACGSTLTAYGAARGVSVAWARLFFLVGPHDAGSRLVPSLVTALRAGKPARCTSGNHIRDFLHVTDAAAALVALLTSEVTGAVNIGSGVPVRVGDLARGVAARVGRPDLLSVEDGASTHQLVTANVARLRNEVGWQPALDIDSALDDTVAWWSAAAPGVPA